MYLTRRCIPLRQLPIYRQNISFYSTSQKNKLTEAQELDKHVLPPANPDASFPRRWWHKGKTLVVFYWRGIKQIWFNRDVVKQIQLKDGPLSHREFQLLTTHKKDIKKLVPFAVLFVLLEEIIPLIAYLAPQVLPSTVVLPSQKVSIRKAIENRRSNALEFYRHSYNQASRRQLLSSLSENDAPIEPQDVRILLRIFDLSTFGTASMRHNRLRNYLSHISEDDACILRQEVEKLKATSFLSEGELSDACSARGFLTLEIDNEKLTKILDEWLANYQKDNIYKPLHLILDQRNIDKSSNKE
ncbi:hypothetical protein WALSEDRAFT_63725 [Wallemia mellicola CBS 633.66]|uniref:Letm1 RBD domain-containing protein n=1 Tax=Wallemia mellicola (strain ATCC MYA-4683 / CBS 633.66) TaxID=671144 RepID=I4YDD4_WALMC|nr:hypothetical protein WALSEDRAFT_63725 [Wallemia mellicola CBS 633.66]EIM21976.1 hypothetical protein WALSEDRAFT_63725 [Wallemia mellicola CBS 633.66]|eukprot:XP_006957786.1 hypothetical protein WALSEDRAFT_63725 [Wallemia mellicola CBS 633.66]